MVEELGEVDHWLDELLKIRTDLHWDKLDWNRRAILERHLADTRWT